VRQEPQTKKAECSESWTEGGTSNAEGRVIGEAQGLNKSKEGLQRLNYGRMVARMEEDQVLMASPRT
jgi:hypothetical protein